MSRRPALSAGATPLGRAISPPAQPRLTRVAAAPRTVRLRPAATTTTRVRKEWPTWTKGKAEDKRKDMKYTKLTRDKAGVVKTTSLVITGASKMWKKAENADLVYLPELRLAGDRNLLDLFTNELVKEGKITAAERQFAFDTAHSSDKVNSAEFLAEVRNYEANRPVSKKVKSEFTLEIITAIYEDSKKTKGQNLMGAVGLPRARKGRETFDQRVLALGAANREVAQRQRAGDPTAVYKFIEVNKFDPANETGASKRDVARTRAIVISLTKFPIGSRDKRQLEDALNLLRRKGVITDADVRSGMAEIANGFGTAQVV